MSVGSRGDRNRVAPRVSVTVEEPSGGDPQWRGGVCGKVPGTGRQCCGPGSAWHCDSEWRGTAGGKGLRMKVKGGRGEETWPRAYSRGSPQDADRFLRLPRC